MAGTPNAEERQKQYCNPNQQQRPSMSPLARVSAIRRPRYFLKILNTICVLDFHRVPKVCQIELRETTGTRSRLRRDLQADRRSCVCRREILPARRICAV